jgi:hypothetical protein
MKERSTRTDAIRDVFLQFDTDRLHAPIRAADEQLRDGADRIAVGADHGSAAKTVIG